MNPVGCWGVYHRTQVSPVGVLLYISLSPEVRTSSNSVEEDNLLSSVPDNLLVPQTVFGFLYALYHHQLLSAFWILPTLWVCSRSPYGFSLYPFWYFVRSNNLWATGLSLFIYSLLFMYLLLKRLVPRLALNKPLPQFDQHWGYRHVASYSDWASFLCACLSLLFFFFFFFVLCVFLHWCVEIFKNMSQIRMHLAEVVDFPTLGFSLFWFFCSLNICLLLNCKLLILIY